MLQSALCSRSRSPALHASRVYCGAGTRGRGGRPHSLSTHDGIASLPPASMGLGGKAPTGTPKAHHSFVGYCGLHACTWEGPPTHPVSTELESTRQSSGRLEAQAGSTGHGSAHRGSSVTTEISAPSQCSPVSTEARSTHKWSVYFDRGRGVTQWLRHKGSTPSGPSMNSGIRNLVRLPVPHGTHT